MFPGWSEGDCRAYFRFGPFGFQMCEEVREGRLRKATPGEPATEQERSDWRQRCRIFFRKQSETAETKKKELAKFVIKKPRLATGDWLKLLDRALRKSGGFGLERFKAKHLLQDIGVWHGTQTGAETPRVCFGILDSQPPPPPPCLTIACDQEQKQLSAISFAQHVMGINIVLLNDVFHRLWNDVSRSVRAAGLWAIYLQTLLIFNISHGPWSKGAWFHNQVEAASNITALLIEDDQLLGKLWPMILMDQGKHFEADDDMVGAPARKQYLEQFSLSKCFTVRGAKCALSRWFSWQTSMAEWDNEWHTRALGLAHLAIEKNWVSSAEQLFEGDTWHASVSSRAPSSKAQAMEESKNKEAAMRSKCANNLHAAAKVMCDKQVTDYARILGLGTRAAWSNNTEVTKTLKGAADTLKFYIDQSQWEWLGMLKKTIACRSDTLELSRCGFLVSFSKADASMMDPDGPHLAYQDSLARVLGRLTDQIVQTRVGSMISYTSWYPCRLASLLDGRFAEQALADFKTDVEAWHVAKQRGDAVLTSMCKHSPFSTPLLAWCIALAQSTGFASVPPQLSELLTKAFRGIGHSRINEEANKLLRDTEVHDSANMTVRFGRMYSVLMNSKLLTSERRDEIQGSSTQAPVPQDSAFDRLFRADITIGDDVSEEVKAGRQISKEIDQVMGKQSWPVHTPASEQQHIAEQRALRWMFVNNAWELAGELWRAAFMPVGQLIEEVSTRAHFFVVKAYNTCFVAWPAAQLQVNLWVYDMAATELCWKFCTSFDEYRAIPTAYTAPLRTWMMDYTKDLGVYHHVKGQPKSILLTQCDLGFGGISERMMKKLTESDLPVELPLCDGADETPTDSKMDMVVACISKLQPSWTAADTRRALTKAFQMDNPDMDCVWSVDSDLVFNVVSHAESKDIKNYYDDVKTMQKDFDKHTTIRAETVAKYYKEARSKRKAAPPRWLPGRNERTCEVTAFVAKHLPNEAKCQEDAYNGRWFIIYEGRVPKSVSWTKRGFSAAASRAIWLGWEYHREMTGVYPPWNMAALEKEVREEVEKLGVV